MKHRRIISSCLLLTVIAATLLAPQTRAQAISDEETVQLRRKIANLNGFLGGIIRNTMYLRFNPFDWFWSPMWSLYDFVWRKNCGEIIVVLCV